MFSCKSLADLSLLLFLLFACCCFTLLALFLVLRALVLGAGAILAPEFACLLPLFELLLVFAPDCLLVDLLS